MGCASSTPMVATAGSDILKSATHVADDVKSNAEGTVKEITTTIEETLDTSKNALNSAISGITTELGHVLENQTKAFDNTKTELMEKLHVTDGPQVPKVDDWLDSSKAAVPPAEKTLEENLEHQLESHSLKAEDMDSLKTSTPEPEIEQALSNNDEEESPPTPKPTLAELANLTENMSDLASSLPSMERPIKTVSTQNNTHTSHTPTAPLAMEIALHDNNYKRPNTTEWEKFADMLAHNRKFMPYEAFSRNVNQFSVYQDYTRNEDGSDLHYDGSFSDASPNTLTSLSQSSLTSPQFKRSVLVPPAAVIVNTISDTQKAKRVPSDFASLMVCEQIDVVSHQNNHSNTTNGRQFDYNPNRERITLQTVGSTPSTVSHIVSTTCTEANGGHHGITNTNSTWKRQHINSIGSNDKQTPQSQILINKLVPISRTSHSSSSSTGTDGVVIKSNLTTPSTLSPVRTSLPSLSKRLGEKLDDKANTNEILTNDVIVSSRNPVLSRSRTPTRRVSNTSSFLSSPRVSPFRGRKENSTGCNDENKPATFIPAFSSVTPSKQRLIPPLSPYRIRERCEVCYNKYVIK